MRWIPFARGVEMRDKMEVRFGYYAFFDLPAAHQGTLGFVPIDLVKGALEHLWVKQ